MAQSLWIVHHGRAGYPTLTFRDALRTCHLHSLYDPVREAASLTDSWQISKSTGEITIVGLGLGYHVAACLKRYPWVRRINVLECHAEVIQLARQWVPNLTEDPRISIQLVDNETAMRQAIGLADIANVYLHPPSVALIPYEDIRALLEEMQMLRTTTANQLDRLIENWESNSPSIHPGNVLTGRQNSRKGQPGILVAAGPSLDTSLHFLHRNAPYATVISVSAALKTLLQSGIVPDYCVVSDSSWKISTHFAEIKSTTDLPELLVLGTAFPGIANIWEGKLTWVLQQGFEPAESLATRESYDLFHTGGSVATLALSVLYYLGCDPIIFVGQDLAYVDNRTHGRGIHQELTGVGSSPAFAITVESVEGKPILSNLSWNSFRHWMEHFIELHPDRTYLNASSGAHIRGTLPMAIPEVERRIRLQASRGRV